MRFQASGFLVHIDRIARHGSGWLNLEIHLSPAI
jgi:hypothetical protein